MLYRYTGPQTAMTLASGREIILRPGGMVELPDDTYVIHTMIALGWLGPVQQPKAKAKDNKE